MALLIFGVVINVLAAITETRIEFDEYFPFAITNFLLQLCLLASCALLYDAFRRFKKVINLEQILNP